MQGNSKIPIIAQIDLLVVGGSTAGVAAACAAARKGADVMLVGSETYLGEDICATGRFWLPGDVGADHPLAKKIFADENGAPARFVRPMDVKKKLDQTLLDAGIRFLFACCPSDLLIDGKGRAAGAVLTGKCGPFAIGAGAVIDATPLAALARAAGVEFSDWDGGALNFRRVVIGHPADSPEDCAQRPLPGFQWTENGSEPIDCRAFEYSARLYLDEWSPAALAGAEQIMRDRTWHPDQLWGADRCAVTPPVHVAGAPTNDVATSTEEPAPDCFLTAIDGLYVLGPCAALPRQTAAKLQVAPSAIDAGDRLGRHLAAIIDRTSPASIPTPMHPIPASTERFCEPSESVRFRREAVNHIQSPAGAEPPLLGEFDVVVAGGGTAGAPAAIAAARSGARVLLVETLHGLGGVGTLGYISRYYHGYHGGFTREITQGLRELAGERCFDPGGWNVEHKSEWLRRKIRGAGGEIWFGTTVSGALMDGEHIRALVLNTQWGRGLVRAKTFIDATGSADVAAAAGAECNFVSDSDLALQGSGLPPRPLVPRYFNTDYTFIDDIDLVDLTRAFITSRRKSENDFDSAQLADTRERRQIVGDVAVSPLHAYMGATWRDTVCLSRSNFDSHGFTVHPLFFVLPPDQTSCDVWLPLRALLPAGIEGMLVTGLALSAHRDVMPVLRMQPDVQNHAYAAGLAAAAAAADNRSLRQIDIRTLQRRLVDAGFLPQSVLLHEDSDRVGGDVIAGAAAGELRHHSELSALMSDPDKAVPLLKDRLDYESDSAAKITCAKLLAFLGNDAGEDILIGAIDIGVWDKGWNYRGMGQFGRSMSPTDDCIVALAHLHSQKAGALLQEKAAQLGEDDAFSHYRAIALYAEVAGGNAWAERLKDLLERPGVSGFALHSFSEALSDAPSNWTDNSTRNKVLRELYLARALYRCEGAGGLGEKILRSYSRDIHGHYARHAEAVLNP